jgi:hypothetical protein
MAFCGDDRIELDCGGAVLDLLLILESLLLYRLGCLHEGHALKAPNPFFLQSFPPSFFQESVLVLDYSLDYSLIFFVRWNS